MKLLKRKEVIELWKSQPEEVLNKYCCPICRDLLSSHDGGEQLYCSNIFCDNSTVYHNPNRQEKGGSEDD